MKKFRWKLSVPYFACDNYGSMRISAMLDYLGETSSLHSDELGLGYKELKENKYGWVLNRWKFKITDYPKAKDDIIIETWTSKVNKFYANREFIIYNMAGEKIAMATTVWIFLNIDRKRPIRIPEEIENKYKMVEEFNFQEFYQFTDLKNDRDIVSFSTRRSDIDYNNHVNNVKYFDWINESIPNEIYNNYKLVEVEILYKQEILYGHEIECKIEKSFDSGEYVEFLHEINISNNTRINAFAKTKWKNMFVHEI